MSFSALFKPCMHIHNKINRVCFFLIFTIIIFSVLSCSSISSTPYSEPDISAEPVENELSNEMIALLDMIKKYENSAIPVEFTDLVDSIDDIEDLVNLSDIIPRIITEEASKNTRILDNYLEDYYDQYSYLEKKINEIYNQNKNNIESLNVLMYIGRKNFGEVRDEAERKLRSIVNDRILNETMTLDELNTCSSVFYIYWNLSNERINEKINSLDIDSAYNYLKYLEALEIPVDCVTTGYYVKTFGLIFEEHILDIINWNEFSENDAYIYDKALEYFPDFKISLEDINSKYTESFENVVSSSSSIPQLNKGLACFTHISLEKIQNAYISILDMLTDGVTQYSQIEDIANEYLEYSDFELPENFIATKSYNLFKQRLSKAETEEDVKSVLSEYLEKSYVDSENALSDAKTRIDEINMLQELKKELNPVYSMLNSSETVDYKKIKTVCADIEQRYKSVITEEISDSVDDIISICNNEIEKQEYLESEEYQLLIFPISNDLLDAPLYYGHKGRAYKAVGTTLREELSNSYKSDFKVDDIGLWNWGEDIQISQYKNLFRNPGVMIKLDNEGRAVVYSASTYVGEYEWKDSYNSIKDIFDDLFSNYEYDDNSALADLLLFLSLS